MEYRREIDGLRAVAVIPVILFHAGMNVFSGGFVGVDVFFVISGYLITSIIISELAAGKFSIARFYERRARRILPALFLVMLCCIPFAWMWMLPSQLENFAKSLVAVTFFSSNMLFWQETGYFSPDSHLKPLLHTWSLAVEEQFYVLFPIAMIFLWRIGRSKLLYFIILAAMGSLAISEWGWRYAPSANFYLLVTRAWELLAGSICAFIAFGKPQKSNDIMSAIGLGLIVFSIFYFDESTPFPSVYALLPVMGTVLIILFGSSGSWVGKVLGLPVFVGIGLVSYSAYLWHQPIFAFAQIRSLSQPSQMLMGGLSILSLVMAYLTWRFVERPFRKPGAAPLPERRQVFVVSAAMGGLLCVLGATGYLTGGLPGRFEVDSMRLEARMVVNLGLSDGCSDGFPETDTCRTASDPEVFLWGDSYAKHIAKGLLSSDPGLKLQQKTASACPPMLGAAPLIAKYGIEYAKKCMEQNNKNFEEIKNNNNIKYVLLSSPFMWIDDVHIISGGSLSKLSLDDVSYIMRDTIYKIRSLGKKVVVFSPTPQNGNDIGQCILKSTILGLDLKRCNIEPSDKSGHSYYNRKSFALMDAISPEVPVIRIDEMICDSARCHVMIDGVFIFRDSGHLSNEGSFYLGRKYNFMKLVRDQAR